MIAVVRIPGVEACGSLQTAEFRPLCEPGANKQSGGDEDVGHTEHDGGADEKPFPRCRVERYFHRVSLAGALPRRTRSSAMRRGLVSFLGVAIVVTRFVVAVIARVLALVFVIV